MRHSLFVPLFTSILLFPLYLLYAQPGQWSEPVNISNTNGGSANPDMALGLNGEIYVVWSDDSRLGNIWMDDILYTYYDGINWSEAEQISSFDTTYSYYPRVAVDSEGNPHVVWNYHSIFPDADIYYSTLTDSGWLTPVNLTAETGTAYKPVIGIDSQDNIYVVWSNYNAGQTDIFYRKFDGFQWLPIDTAITTPYYSANIDMQIDSQDNIHIVWRDNAYMAEDIFYSKYDGESWSSPQNISQMPTLTSDDPSLALDSQDNPHVVWKQSLGGLLSEIYYSYFNGENWSSSIDITNLGFTTDYPKLAISFQNFKYLLFMLFYQNGDFYVNFTYCIDSVWTLPDTLIPEYISANSDICLDSTKILAVISVTEVPLFSDLMYMYNTQTSFSKKYDSNNNKIFDFQLHPNPTNCKTNIYFNIKSNSNIELKVFNISGQLVDLLFNNICSAGQYYLTWEGIDLEGKKVSTGLYLIRLSINGTSIIKKLIIIK